MVDPDSTRPAGQPQGSRGRRQDRSRGAVLVEAAMVFPILVLLVFGAIEYGFIFHDYIIMSTAARSGARAGTADKDATGLHVNADDDYQILQSISTALGSLKSKVEYVTIYQATSQANGQPPPSCSGASPASGPTCNVYTAADFSKTAAQIEAEDLGDWDPSTRTIALSDVVEPTYLGVYIKSSHSYLTGLFGSSRNISEGAVLRFEPSSVQSGRSHPSTSTSAAASTTATTPTTAGGGGTTTTAPPGTTTTVKPTTTTAKATTTTAGGGGTTTTAKATTTTAKATTTTAKATTTTAGPTTTSGPTTTLPALPPPPPQ